MVAKAGDGALVGPPGTMLAIIIVPTKKKLHTANAMQFIERYVIWTPIL